MATSSTTSPQAAPAIVVSTSTEIVRGSVPAIINIPDLEAAKVVTASYGSATCRCWALPGDVTGQPAVSEGVCDQLGLTPGSAGTITLSDLATDELTAIRAPASRMNRAWRVGPAGHPHPLQPWRSATRSVLSVGDRWLVIDSKVAPTGDTIELNRFQMDLLGINPDTTVRCSPLGAPPRARTSSGPVRPIEWVTTIWRRLATALEAVVRFFLGAPEMSMVITWGTQGDDQQTVRVDPSILPFLGCVEGDVLVVRGATGRAMVTAVARGVPEDFTDTQLVPMHPCRQRREQATRTGVIPNLLISVPAPVREDIGEFAGSVVRVRRRVLGVLGRNALALTSPIFTGVIALAAIGQRSEPASTAANRDGFEWFAHGLPLGVGLATALLVMWSLRHKAPRSGRWP